MKHSQNRQLSEPSIHIALPSWVVKTGLAFNILFLKNVMAKSILDSRIHLRGMFQAY